MFVEHPSHREQIAAMQHLRIDDLCAMLGCTRQHIRNMILRDEFPAGRKFGHLRRWSVTEIENHLKKESK